MKVGAAQKAKAAMQQNFEQMWDELYEWREQHPEASFDEIAGQVSPRRRVLIGQMLGQLACQHGDGEVVEGVTCWKCGAAMSYKGKPTREIEHLEGETELVRAYYYCADCESGLFPLDEQLYLGEHSWSPETVKQIVRQGTEIPSHRRAAESFQAMTKIPLSKSSMGRLVTRYGHKIVVQQQAEAEATVKPPKREEIISPRQMPQPDSEVMAVSMDGAMLNIRGEGWKEVKTVCISAVETVPNPESGEAEVHLTRHSYRAGLWEASEFAQHQWAEGCRRGLERAKQLVSVNDGAAWIWLIVAMCWAPCVEILDGWHLIEKLWGVASALFADAPVARNQWMETQKAQVWGSGPRQVLRAIRELCPRGHPLPEPVRLGVAYLFEHRWRTRYQQFRQAGYPIGSGSVESACKLVMQARMKQAGMRWSREGAQAMLALRSELLSERWDQVWASFRPAPKLA